MKKLSFTQVLKDTINDTNEEILCAFRVVRPDELLANKAGKSIVCKNPDATYTAEEHVRSGKRDSAWISVTDSFLVALGWAIQFGCGIVVIDYSKIETEKVDFRQGFSGKKGIASNWAIASREICVKGEIKADAIVAVISPDQLFLFQQPNKEYKAVVDAAANPYKEAINSTVARVEKLSRNLKTWTNNPSSLIPEVCKLWSVKEWLWAERVYA